MQVSKPISFFYLFIISSLCIVSGCGSRNGSRSHHVKPQAAATVVQGVPCTLHVEGVECKLCAQSVINLVSKISGVSNVRYHTTDATYSDSYLTFSFDPACGAISREQLQAELLKEGFSLVSLSPNFC